MSLSHAIFSENGALCFFKVLLLTKVFLGTPDFYDFCYICDPACENLIFVADMSFLDNDCKR